MQANDAHQQPLDLVVKREIRDTVGDETIRRQKDALAAWNLSIAESGLDDKLIYLDLGIDAAQFSRMRTGKANYPINRLSQFMDVVGNEILLRYLAWERGYGLVRLQSEVERENEFLKQEKAELEKKVEHFQEFLKLSK